LIWVLAELVVCPGYLANICRRVTLNARLPNVDGVAFFFAVALEPDRAETLRVVCSQLEELKNIDDDSSGELDAYRESLGI
jgi:hypothetical protein